MKRLNPTTNLPFKRGDQREDGLYFLGYTNSYIKKDGFFAEQWGSYEKIEKARAISRQYFAEHDYYQKYKDANLDKERARGRAKYYAKRDYLLQKQRERHAMVKSLINPTKQMYGRARSVGRRFQRYPMPSWLSVEQLQLMEKAYISADHLRQVTGEWYGVDHIIPLGAPNVCGLHVPWNLQILTRKENSSKGFKNNS